MENQLDSIAKSYDKAIALGKQGIDQYADLPKHILNDPDYPLFQALAAEGNLSDSGRKEIMDFLAPDASMQFIDLGCCLNLMFRGYDKWPSLYHGVDISNETIALLKTFAAEKELTVGALCCGSLHETHLPDRYFDIGACIGVLEYFARDFVASALSEMHRIMKPYGRFVLDIPNIGSPAYRIMALIEVHLDRPGKFLMLPADFEDMLHPYFIVEKREIVGPMIQYFLHRKKV